MWEHIIIAILFCLALVVMYFHFKNAWQGDCGRCSDSCESCQHKPAVIDLKDDDK